MYAGASGDFNPMHPDEVAAQAAGLPSVFGHGMFTVGLLGKALTDYVGVGNLRNYKIRFTKQTWPGETLTTHVTVAKKYDGGRASTGSTSSARSRTRTARPSSPASPSPRSRAAAEPDR